MYRILIADDSQYMRENLREIMHDIGYEVVGEATNGLDVVELYRFLLPDIVFVDMKMPESSGIDALKRIIDINKDAVVIMLSVVGKPDQVLEALNCGAKSYLTKPFDKASALHAIKQAMLEES
ncbi:response regulator [Oscillospiraceae bacterium CM]|nr:response regulator [Oscillospiraceae bacterium CM]